MLFGGLHQRSPAQGETYLIGAAEEGHKTAAYVLGVVMYNDDRVDDAKVYMRQVDGDTAYVGVHNKKMILNTECDQWRERAVHAVWAMTWRLRNADVSFNKKGDHRCTTPSCGSRRGWTQWVAFCSEDCRIVHEHDQFYSSVEPPNM